MSQSHTLPSRRFLVKDVSLWHSYWILLHFPIIWSTMAVNTIKKWRRSFCKRNTILSSNMQISLETCRWTSTKKDFWVSWAITVTRVIWNVKRLTLQFWWGSSDREARERFGKRNIKLVERSRAKHHYKLQELNLCIYCLANVEYRETFWWTDVIWVSSVTSEVAVLQLFVTIN